MKLSELAAGKWPEILMANGFTELELNGKHQPCASCGGTDRFRFIRADRNGGFFCGDLRGDGFALLQHRFGVNFNEAAKLVERVVGKGSPPPVDQNYLKQQKRIELAMRPLSGMAVEYLASRGLEPSAKLHMAELDYWDQVDGKPVKLGKFTAMVARLTSPDGITAAYHITYLKDGRKADVPSPRKIVAAKKEIRGCAIRLFEAGETLGVAEGIETALAANKIFGVPVWAVGNTALMRNFTPPPGVKNLRIFGDNDPGWAGHAAAYALAHRVFGAVKATVEIPQIRGHDWCDVLCRKGL